MFAALAVGLVAALFAVQWNRPMTIAGSAHHVQPLAPADVLQPSPFAGNFAITHTITSANTRILGEEAPHGLEHIAVHPETGELWGAAPNGTVFSMSMQAGRPLESTLRAEFDAGPGRVLGYTWDADGAMYLCNLEQGLQHRSAGGLISVVSAAVSTASALRPGQPLAMPNSAAVSPTTGKVYFTDSTDVATAGPHTSPFRVSQLAVLVGRKSGMLLEYDPQTQQTVCLLDDLWFANGVAMAPDGSFLLLADTIRMSIIKVWLSGPQAGQRKVILENLPAFPDNISLLPETGTFWVALYARASPLMTTTSIFTSSWVRALIGHIPEAITAKFALKVAGGMELDGDGQVLRVVADKAGEVAHGTTSGVLSRNAGTLVMGRLHGPLAVVDLKL